jgi:HK97 family phage major capsid protein
MDITEQLKQLETNLSEEVKSGIKTESEKRETLEGAIKELSDKMKEFEESKGVSVPGSEDEGFSFHKCFSHVSKGGNLNSIGGVEGEIISQTMKSNSTLTPAEGGVFIPTEISANVVDEALAKMTVTKMNVQRLKVNGSSKISVPTVVDGSTAYWVNDLVSITESDVTFGNVDLEPHKLGAYVVASGELLAQGANIENYILNSMGEQLGLLADLASLTGDGTNKPTGITQSANIIPINNDATNGDATDKSLFQQLMDALENANTLEGAPGFIGRPEHFQTLRNQTIANFSGQTDGQPLFDMFLSNEQLANQIGYPIASTTQLATTASGTHNTADLIFGDFSKMLLATWGNIELASSIHPKFQQYGVALRAIMRMDSAVLRGSSFAVATKGQVSTV